MDIVISVDAYFVYIYPLNIYKAQLVSTSIENIGKQRMKRL